MVELPQIIETFTPLIPGPGAVPGKEQDKIPARVTLTGNICPTMAGI